MPGSQDTMRTGRAVAALIAVVMFVTGGCSGGSTTPPSPSASSSRVGWQPGEYRTSPKLCGAVSDKTLHRLGMEVLSPLPGEKCRWRKDDDDVERELRLIHRTFTPPSPRPDYSATDEARHGFQRPQGWGFGAATPVRGLGDEAKIGRVVFPGGRREVAVAVRVRNVVLQVHVKARAGEDDAGIRVPPLGDLEAVAYGAVRDVLGVLKAAPTARPSPGYASGEVREVHKVCGSVDAGRRLLPGARRHDSPKGSGLSAGCFWGEKHSDTDGLLVTVEAVPPSPVTGQSATKVAEAALGEWRSADEYKRRSGLGDEARVYHYKSDSLRDVHVDVRRGNLLVHVGYELWAGGKSISTMDDDVVRVAKAILADYT